MSTSETLSLLRANVPSFVNLVYLLRRMSLTRCDSDGIENVHESMHGLVDFLCKVDISELCPSEVDTAGVDLVPPPKKKSHIVCKAESELEEINAIERQVRSADNALRELVGKAKAFRETAFTELNEMRRIHHEFETNETGVNCRPPSPWSFSLGALLDRHHDDLIPIRGGFPLGHYREEEEQEELADIDLVTGRGEEAKTIENFSGTPPSSPKVSSVSAPPAARRPGRPKKKKDFVVVE